MRTLLVSVAAFLFAAVSSAQAERRMFIIPNNADGYGVDRCLANGEKCGQAAAAAYCKTQSFADASSYRKIDKDDITGAIPNSGGNACHGANCDNFVAIVCSR
jgi:hypothetical protein